MSEAAILLMWLRCGEQTFDLLNYCGSMWNLVLIGPVFSEKKAVEEFTRISLCKISDPWGGAIFYPRAIIWIIFIEVHKIKLHTKYHRPGPSSFRQDCFFNCAYRSLCNRVWPFRKKGQGQPMVISFFKLHWAYVPNTAYKAPGPLALLVPEKKILKVFFLLYLGVVAILVMWSRCGEQTFVPSTQ